MGLKMTKKKVMVVNNTPISANNVLIENAEGFAYLGQDKENNQDKYIQRRIMADWAAYAKYRDIYKRNLAICLKRQLYNSCVLPAMAYGVETWALTKQAHIKVKISMLNITYKDRMTNVRVRERAQVIDIISNVRKLKWSCVGNINRLNDDRWASRATTYTMRQEKTTWETSQAAERRPGQILERHDMAEESTR